MIIRKYIPNTITCLNSLSGCIAIVMALSGNLMAAALWILVAAIFDFFDGFAARLLKSYSKIGGELDSLSDVVSFGVAPGMMLYQYLVSMNSQAVLPVWIPFVAMVIPVLSGVRLAKFNVDERQTTSFLGLPVPAHALFWASYVNGIADYMVFSASFMIVVTLILAILSSFLLVSEIPMFSFKIKSLAWKSNIQRYLLLIGAILLLVFLGMLGASATVLLYVILSLIIKDY